MIIVEIDGNKDSLEKALKKYKRKHDKLKINKKLRERQTFTKKSVKRREEIKKAIYVTSKYKNND